MRCFAYGATDTTYRMSQDCSFSVEAEALFDATVDAIILINHHGIIEAFNASAERLFGYKAEEVLGRNVKLLMTDRDSASHDAYLERYLRTGVPHIIGMGRDVTARAKDGHEFPGLLSVGRIAGSDPPRFVGFIHDLTLRQQALAAAQRERDRANRYLEAVQTILLALDTDHRVTLINRAGCEVLNYSEEALLGQSWIDTVVAESDRAGVKADLHAMVTGTRGGPLYRQYSVITRGRMECLIAWRCVVLSDADGNAIGFLCSGEDVTEERRAEREAGDARERMMHVSRLATMGEMATGISHELNQPLAAIANYAQAGSRLLASDRPHLEDAREALAQIAAQALRAGEIIRRLRALVRNRATERELAYINDVILEMGPLINADTRANDVRITFDLAPEALVVNVDRVQIQQVLLNLIRNSIDALEANAARQREICVRTSTNDAGEVLVIVHDNGPGIASEVRDRLFTQFVTTKAAGTGLGLAISRTIMEAHRGRLICDSATTNGATFIFALPGHQGLPQ